MEPLSLSSKVKNIICLLNLFGKVGRILMVWLCISIETNGQGLVYSKDGISYTVNVQLVKSEKRYDEIRYIYSINLVLTNDTDEDVKIQYAVVNQPIRCWKVDAPSCFGTDIEQGWKQEFVLSANKTITYQGCWASTCDYIIPGWNIKPLYFIKKRENSPQPTPPPKQTPTTTYPPKGYRYGDPIDRSPSKPSYEDTQQKQREEAQRRQEEQRRKEEEKRQQEETDRLRKQTLFNDYFLKGIDYENEEKFGAARSQYNLALTYAQNEAERKEVSTRLGYIDRAERDKAQADKAEQQRLQQEAEKARLEEVRRQNMETYNNFTRELEQKQQQNEELANSLQPVIENILNLEVDPLKETDNIFIINGNYTHLLAPFVISNQTQSLNEGENSPSWNFTCGQLNKKGLSFLLSFEFLEMKISNFKFNGLSTSGNRVNFSGDMKASSQNFSVTIGKDFRTPSNKLHLFLGPSLSYFILTDHVFNYGAGLSKEYRQGGLKEKQFLYGFNSKILLFITNGIGISIGYEARIPIKKTDTNFNYYPNKLSYAHAGLYFRM